MPTGVAQVVVSIFEWLWGPIRDTPWEDLRGFWLARVLDDRFVVAYFLPLTAVLLLLSRRRLRLGIVLTGLAFMTYVMGAFYPLFWLLQCWVFFRLAERFAAESKRTDVLRWGPPLAAIFSIAGWYLFTQAIQHLKIPNVTEPLHGLFPWLFPLGARGLAGQPFLCEPLFPENYLYGTADPPPLFHAVFHNPHNIGTAYFTIRMMHYFSEVRRGGIEVHRRKFMNFLAWLCYAPNLIQGPIERFNEFQAEMDTCHQRRSWRNVPPALARIAWGVFKSFIVVWYFIPVLWYKLGGGDPAQRRYYDRPEEIDSYALLYFGVYLQIYKLYLQFSGYCDVSAGIARLLGYRQVENFNWPWLATSLRDFWRRWHISLSAICRDYIYIPLGGNRRRTTLSLVITFVLVGVWHAPHFRYVAWGVVMGLMLAVNQWWAHWMKRLDQAGADGRAEGRPVGWLPALRRIVIRTRPLPTVLSWALTMHCFCSSLLIFFGGSGAIRVTKELIFRPLRWLMGW